MLIANANAKGGTGKTTLSVGLVGEAASRGRRALLVDLDVQGNATEHLIGIGDALRSPQGDGGRSFYRTIMDGDTPNPVRVSENLDLLPAGPRTQTLADELQRMSATSNDALGRSLGALRTGLHEAFADYDLVVFDTPPSEQSHALLDTVLVASDAVVVPTKISKGDADGAIRLLQRLAGLERLGTQYAMPLGAALMAVPNGATRLVAHAEDELRVITDFIPLFASRIHFRPAPISEAERRHLTLRGLQEVMPTAASRLASLRTGERTSGEHLSTDSVTRTVDEFAALYDEMLDRANSNGIAA